MKVLRETSFSPWSGCCFSAKHTALRRKDEDWLAQNQDNVSEWGDICLSVDCCFIELELQKST
jgi:hypothetical protein